MECVKEIIDPGKLNGIIRLPQKMKKRKVEVIVLPADEPIEESTVQAKLRAVEELNGLIADQSKEKLDEFDNIISRRINLRKTAVEL
ncbi:MAG: hypothetical protein KAW12_06730 [Candidatus Aminicenantes bacterium]|nr:hypothetical protein [Candidatus Aminicenantes bacterium]